MSQIVQQSAPQLTATRATTKRGSVTPAAAGSRKGPSSARMALRILGLFSEQEPVLGVSEIGRRLGIHKSKASRLISALSAEDFVKKGEGGRYSLGHRLYGIGLAVPHSQALVAAARSELYEIGQATGENVHLAMLLGHDVVHLDRIYATHLMKRVLNDSPNSPIHATSTGKVLLAHTDEAIVDKLLSDGMPRYTKFTVTDPAIFKDQLRAVQAAGYSIAREEYRLGMGSVAVPVFSRGATSVAAIAVVAPSDNLMGGKLETVLDILRRSAARIGRRV